MPANRGLVTITAVSGNDVSNPLKILDYDLRAVTDVDVSNGKLIVDSISSTEMTNNTKFVVDIDYSNGKLEVIKDNINIDFPEKNWYNKPVTNHKEEKSCVIKNHTTSPRQ